LGLNARGFLVASLAHLAQLDEARREPAEALRLRPEVTVGIAPLMMPSGNPDLVERFLEGLREAGLPE
jgi:hypothetical protein